MWPSRYTYDIFLSYAAEDRPVVNAIREGLLKRGLRVWYVREDMPYGEQLERAIAAAMHKSRFIVAIVSKDYLASRWAVWEYGVFRERDARGQRTILQVLYNISIEDVENTFIRTDRWSMIYEDNADDIAEQVYYEVRRRRTTGVKAWFDENTYALRFWFIFIAVIAGGVFVVADYCGQRPCGQVEVMLAAHLREVEQQMTEEKEFLMASSQLGNASILEIQEVYNRFKSLHSRYSNTYELLGDGEKLVSKRNVSQALNDDPGTWTPGNRYDLVAPEVYLSPAPVVSPNPKVTYMLSNTAPLHYEIVERGLTGDGRYEIGVKFEENIRFIAVNLTFPSSFNEVRYHHVRIRGFERYQRYVFIRNGGTWTLNRDDE